MSDIKVKKVAEDVWEATHVPTKLNIRSHNKLMAVFKLGALVDRQMKLKFDNSNCDDCKEEYHQYVKSSVDPS